jgi:hypothetical protein
MMIAMQVQKRYSRAPITEALIDFQVELVTKQHLTGRVVPQVTTKWFSEQFFVRSINPRPCSGLITHDAKLKQKERLNETLKLRII